MAHRQSGFTRASSLGPIAEFMDRQGGSIARVLNAVDLPFALLERPEVLVPLREQFRLLHRAARETGDPHFGARLGQEVRIRNLSAFGKWVSEAERLDDAIERAMHGLNTMLQTSTALALTRRGPIVKWSIEFLDPECEGRYHNELLALCYMIDVVRCYAGRAWTPSLVLTTSARGTPKGALEQIFRANVSTGHDVSAIEFDASLLAGADNRPANVERRRRSSFVEEPPVPREEDELATVVAVTGLALCEGYPRIDWVAAKLGMTRRTLQRRLSDSGTSFVRLVEELLLKSSQALLAGTAEPVTGIALKLGYTDTAHFTRAFKRWTGMSPSVYRRARS
jgi:AraC-like DNA-binding protein